MYTASAKSILNSVRLRKASGIAYCAFHGSFIVGADSGGLDFGRRVEAVDSREILHDLHAAPVAVHVAEAADIHEDVEAKLLAGGEGTRQLVVASAMAQAEGDDFAAARLARTFNRSTKLPVGVMTVAVEE